MKKLIILLILVAFTVQCSSSRYTAPSNICNFLGEIFSEPSKLRELKNNFPGFIEDSLLHPKMKNKEFTEILFQFVQKEYSNVSLKNKFIFYSASLDKYSLSEFDSNAIIHKYNKKDIYVQSYKIPKSEACLKFYWIQIQSQYFLYSITCGYPYKM